MNLKQKLFAVLALLLGLAAAAHAELPAAVTTTGLCCTNQGLRLSGRMTA